VGAIPGRAGPSAGLESGTGLRSLSDLENEGPLGSIIRDKKFTRGQIFIHKRLQAPKSDRLRRPVGRETTGREARATTNDSGAPSSGRTRWALLRFAPGWRGLGARPGADDGVLDTEVVGPDEKKHADHGVNESLGRGRYGRLEKRPGAAGDFRVDLF
jgi:hypothetical protein